MSSKKLRKYRLLSVTVFLLVVPLFVPSGDKPYMPLTKRNFMLQLATQLDAEFGLDHFLELQTPSLQRRSVEFARGVFLCSA